MAADTQCLLEGLALGCSKEKYCRVAGKAAILIDVWHASSPRVSKLFWFQPTCWGSHAI